MDASKEAPKNAPEPSQDGRRKLMRFVRIPALATAAALLAITIGYFLASDYMRSDRIRGVLQTAMFAAGFTVFALSIANIALGAILALTGSARHPRKMAIAAVGWILLAAFGLAAASVSAFLSTLASGFPSI